MNKENDNTTIPINTALPQSNLVETKSPYSLRPKSKHPVESLIHTFQIKDQQDEVEPDIDRKRLERLEKNRLAAKESRLKKKQEILQIKQELERLRVENVRLKQEIEQLRRVLVENNLSVPISNSSLAEYKDLADFLEFPSEDS